MDQSGKGGNSIKGCLPCVSGVHSWCSTCCISPSAHCSPEWNSPFPHLRLGMFVNSPKKKERVPQPGMQGGRFGEKEGEYRIFLPSLLLWMYLLFFSFSPTPPPAHSQTPIWTLSRAFLAHLFLSKLFLVPVPQHALFTVRTVPYLAQPREALHGLIVFEKSFLQGPHNPALDSPEANSFDLQ